MSRIDERIGERMGERINERINERIGERIGERFGASVRSLREARRWSQEQLAGRAELNRSYLGEVERGDAMPSLATADKLAAALGLSLADLLRQCEAPAEAAAPQPRMTTA